MRDKKNTKTKPQKRSTIRILKWIFAIVVVLILLVFLLAPAFVSSRKGQEIILAKVNTLLDGQTNFANLTMGWFKGIKVTDFSFNDNIDQTSVQVKQIATKPHYGSILMGNLSFGQTVIDEPRVNINIKPEQAKKTIISQREPSARRKPQEVTLPIKNIDLKVNNGNFKVTDSKAQTVELSQINSSFKLRPPGESTDFDVDLLVVDKDQASRISAEAEVKPGSKKGWTFRGTSGRLTVEVNDLDLGSLGPVFALAGVGLEAKGRISAKIKSEISSGQLESASGTIKGSNVDVTGDLMKGDRFTTSSLDGALELQSDEKFVNVGKLEVKTDWLKAQVAGAVPTTMKSLADLTKTDSEYNLQGSFDCDLAELMSQFPHSLGVREAATVTSGRLSGTVDTKVETGKRKVFAQASLEGLKGVVEGKTIALSQPVKAEAEVTAENEKIVFDKMDVTASFAKLACSGGIESLQYSADVDLSGLQTEIGQFVDMTGYKLAGEISEKGTLSIKEDKITAAGSSAISNLSITSKEGVTVSEPQAQMNFAVGFDRKEHIATIDSIETTASFGRLDVTDAVVPVGAKAKKGMELTLSAAVDLEKLRPLAVIFASLPKETLLAGIADSKFKVSSAGDLYTFRTDSTTIRKFELVTPGQKPFTSEQAKLNFDGDYNFVVKDWSIRKFELLDPNTKIIFEGGKSVKGDKTLFRGRAQLEYDWSVLSNLASQFLPKGITIEGKRKDPIEFSSEYPTDKPDEFRANLNATAKLGFNKARYMGLVFEPTKLDIQIRKGLLEISPCSTSVNGGKLNFAAKVDLKEEPMVLRIAGPMQIIEKININDEVGRQLLEYLNPIFKNQANITGVANFHADKLAIPLGGGGKVQPEIVGTVAIDNMRLQTLGLIGQILSRADARPYVNAALLPTKFVLQNGRLSYDDMPIHLDMYPVNFSGSIGPKRILNMTVDTPYVVTEDFKIRTVKVGEQTRYRRFRLPLGGTIDGPKLDLSKLFQQQLREQLENQLRKGLEDIFK